MKVNGRIIKPMAKESFGMPTEMFMRVTGKKIRLMDMEFTFT